MTRLSTDMMMNSRDGSDTGLQYTLNSTLIKSECNEREYMDIRSFQLDIGREDIYN